MEHIAQHETRSFLVRLRDRRRQRDLSMKRTSQKSNSIVPLPIPPGSRTCQDCFWWQFVITILRAEHEHTFCDVKPLPPFNALHTASQIVGFPPSFLILCLRAYPSQLRISCIGYSGLPIHSVATWDASNNGSQARKAMALVEMVHEHPTSSRYRDVQGKTPLSLALASGTSWQSGVRRLTLAQKENSFVKRL
jgi:hypothetical protein